MGQLVLGIDPGTRFVGFGLIEIERGKYRAIDHGFFPVDKKRSFPERLLQIHRAIFDLLDKYQPDAVAVEEVYVSQNAKTTLRLGHARGVILLAIIEKDIPIAEYAPREIKQAVSGRGGATKDQVMWMMSKLLHLEIDDLQEDAADGLAVALCHALRSSGPAAQMISKLK